MSRAAWVVGSIWLGLWSGACGKHASGSAADGGVGASHDAHVGTVPTLDEVPAQLAKAVCAQLTTCVDGTFFSSVVGGATCEGKQEAQLQDKTFAELAAAVKAGTVHYNADKVAACIAGLDSAGCAIAQERLSDVAGCNDMFVGTIAVGAACDVDAACLGDAYCKRGSTCPGKCTQRGAAGDACVRDDDCASPLICSSGGQCEKLAQAGESCGAGIAPDCVLGLLCAGDGANTQQTGTCKAYKDVFVGKVGDVCDLQTGTIYCENGLSCLIGVQNNQATFGCAALVAADGPCSFGVPTQCPDGQHCSADVATGVTTGTCVAMPVVGEDCLSSTSDSLTPCALGLYCGVDNKCHSLGRLGASCGDDSDCASQRCDAGTCKEPALCTL